MKRKFVFCIIALILLFTGCSNDNSCLNEEDNVKVDQTYNDEKIEQESIMEINEKLDENLYVQSMFEIPSVNFYTYTTELKQFDFDTVQTLFWDEEQLKNVSEDEFGSKHCGNASLGGERGALIYRSNNEASYIDTLCAYCKEKKNMEQKNLSFLSVEDAKKNTEELIARMGIGCELGNPTVISLNANDIVTIADCMLNDEEYANTIPSANLYDFGLNTNADIYYLEYSLCIGNLNVYGLNDPVVQMSGDTPLLAHPMNVKVILSNEGIKLVQVMGGVNIFEETAAPVDIIGYEGIKEALLKKFGDVILTQEYTVTNMWIEYFPLVKSGSFYEINLIPIWCCDFEIGGENVDYTIRFNAVTGDEIS